MICYKLTFLAALFINNLLASNVRLAAAAANTTVNNNDNDNNNKPAQNTSFSSSK